MGVVGGKAAAPDSKGGGIGRAMGSYIDMNVTWKDLDWIREQIRPVLAPSSSSSSSASPSSSARLPAPESIPIGAKGIQSVPDALLAIQSGANIIWLSNHGGRGLDTAPPALYVLAELRRDHPWVFSVPGVEFYIDGGVRRGTDVVKALCLGARGVAMGRPFVYALQYGTEGVRHAIQSELFLSRFPHLIHPSTASAACSSSLVLTEHLLILFPLLCLVFFLLVIRDEIETTMRLIGATKISDLGPHLINTKALQPLLNDPVPVPLSLIPTSVPMRARL